VVAADKCTECVGAFDAPKCVEVCPVEGCITVDASLNESKEVLQARYASLHP
jgi:Fe-S-cluster-containing dehydrogenase component